MPWLAGTALLHSAVVMEKRNALKIWTVLLAILTFSLSLIGTFLVRSGVLTSVHAFANDPLRGVFILAILVAFIGGGLALFAARAPLLKRGGLFAPISREGALILNNLLMTTSCLTVLVGTLYPLALEVATGAKISVGAPFFNLTFGPLFAWKRGDLAGVTQRLTAAFVLAILGGVATLAAQGAAAGLASLGVGLALFVMTAPSLISSNARVSCACRRRRRSRGPAACRAPRGAPRSRISASRLRSSASSPWRLGRASASSRSSRRNRSRFRAMR